MTGDPNDAIQMKSGGLRTPERIACPDLAALLLAAITLISISLTLRAEENTVEVEGVTFSKTVTLQEWRRSPDVIDGFDWSLPTGAKAHPNSSIQFRPQNLDSFPGNLSRHLNVTWRELEPREGEFHFEILDEKLKGILKSGASKVTLRLTGAAKTADFFDAQGNRIPHDQLDRNQRRELGWSHTAPTWLEALDIPTSSAEPQLGYEGRIVNYEIFHPAYHERYLRMLRALAKTEFLQRPEVSVIYIHTSSSTPGEEGPGPSPGNPAYPKMLERMETWAKAVGPDAKKLVLTGGHPDLLKAAYEMNIGVRAGYVERYLLHTDDPAMGQFIDADGYLTVDESHPLIAKGLASGDENEEYVFTGNTHVQRFGPIPSWPHRYLESSLRVLQMRRTFLWEQNGGHSINPPLTAYVGLSLGHTVNSSPDAWCYLRESTVKEGNRWKGKPIPVKNFERWLHQRDSPGFETTAVKRVDIPTPKESFIYNKAYVEGQTHDFVARQGKRFGFTIDDRFLPNPRDPAVVKITFYDEAPWKLVYQSPQGEVALKAPFKGDGALRTVTFFLADALLHQSDKVHDFEIHALNEPATIRFVRLIRRPPQSS